MAAGGEPLRFVGDGVTSGCVSWVTTSLLDVAVAASDWSDDCVVEDEAKEAVEDWARAVVAKGAASTPATEAIVERTGSRAAGDMVEGEGRADREEERRNRAANS